MNINILSIKKSLKKTGGNVGIAILFNKAMSSNSLVISGNAFETRKPGGGGEGRGGDSAPHPREMIKGIFRPPL